MNREPFPRDEVADRGIPQLNTRSGGTPAAIKVIGVVAVILALLGAAALVGMQKLKEQRQASKPAESKSETVSKLPDLDPSLVPGSGSDTPIPEPSPAPKDGISSTTTSHGASAGEVQAVPSQDGQLVPALSAQQQETADLRERRKRAPLLAFGEGSDSGIGGAGLPQAAAQALPALAMPAFNFPQQSKPDDQPASVGLDKTLQPTATPATSAQALRDPNMTLTQARTIPCVLNTAINSQVPGMVSCTVTSNVYSTNGRVLLVERGSLVVGEYQNAQFKQGMNRIFVLWTRVETPTGVTVALDSPGTDALGRSGVAGKVNRHFWERFGSGLLLSIVDDAVAYAARQQEDRKQGGGVTFNNTSETGRSAAEIAVENSIGIPPTISINQGAIVNVFVARDLYFGGVYGLRTAGR